MDFPSKKCKLNSQFSTIRRYRLRHQWQRKFFGAEHILQRETSHRNRSLVDNHRHGTDYNAPNYCRHSAIVRCAGLSHVVHWASIECGHVLAALPTGSVACEKDRQVGRRKSRIKFANNRMRLLCVGQAKESKFHFQSIFVQCRQCECDWL